MGHPILMTTESVKAILDGRKTQTRRVVKPQPELTIADGFYKANIQKLIEGGDRVCPHGQVGDRLWVRETWAVEYVYDNHKPVDIPQRARVYYKTQDLRGIAFVGKWRPSLFMPRWASRLTLEITEVRVERLAEITDEDCFAEGVKFSIKMKEPTAIFKDLWDTINGKKYPWSSNPWCWVIRFDNIGVRVK